MRVTHVCKLVHSVLLTSTFEAGERWSRDATASTARLLQSIVALGLEVKHRAERRIDDLTLIPYSCLHFGPHATPRVRSGYSVVQQLAQPIAVDT